MKVKLRVDPAELRISDLKNPNFRSQNPNFKFEISDPCLACRPFPTVIVEPNKKILTACPRAWLRVAASGTQSPPRAAPHSALSQERLPRPAPPGIPRSPAHARPLHRTFFRGKYATMKDSPLPAGHPLLRQSPARPRSPWKRAP